MISNSISLEATAAELLALAVVSAFPAAQLLRAGCDGFGFYYDVFVEQPLTFEFAPLLEEHIRGSIKAALKINTSHMMRENAAALFEHRGQRAKAELALLLPANIIEVISIGQFCDLAFAPCLASLPKETVVKILAISAREFYLESLGALPTMRIYAIVGADKTITKAKAKLFAATKNQQHAFLGEAMQLFSVDETPANLGAKWLPKGATVRHLLYEYWRKELAFQGFQFAHTAAFSAVKEVRKNQRSQLLPSITYEDCAYAHMPMSAKQHALCFANDTYTEHNLPLRLASMNDFFYDIPLDQLNALFVTRSFSADNAHIFCCPEQVPAELISSLQFIIKIVKIIDAECLWILTTSPPKGDDVAGQWKKAFQWTSQALQACGIEYQLRAPSKELPADTSLLEVCFKDSLGRLWRGPRLGFNFHLSTQYSLRYKKQDGSRPQPVVIECSFFGSIECLLGILLERSCGWLPLAFTPEQVRVIPVGDRHVPYAKEILCALQQAGCRGTLDCPAGAKDNSLLAKVNAAQSCKVPYVLTVGDQELQRGSIAVRRLGEPHVLSKQASPLNVLSKGDDRLGSQKQRSKDAFLAKNLPSSITCCQLDSFVQQLQDEACLKPPKTCNLGVSTHVES